MWNPSFQFGYFKIGVVVRQCFNIWKASSHSELHLNSTSFLTYEAIKREPTWEAWINDFNKALKYNEVRDEADKLFILGRNLGGRASKYFKYHAMSYHNYESTCINLKKNFRQKNMIFRLRQQLNKAMQTGTLFDYTINLNNLIAKLRNTVNESEALYCYKQGLSSHHKEQVAIHREKLLAELQDQLLGIKSVEGVMVRGKEFETDYMDVDIEALNAVTRYGKGRF